MEVAYGEVSEPWKLLMNLPSQPWVAYWKMLIKKTECTINHVVKVYDTNAQRKNINENISLTTTHVDSFMQFGGLIENV